MFTKILFYDDEGDIMLDYAYSAYVCDSKDSTGVRIEISDGCCIWIQESFPDSLIRSLWSNDRVDLTKYGAVVWICGNGRWSNGEVDYESDEDDKSEQGNQSKTSTSKSTIKSKDSVYGIDSSTGDD